MSDDIYTDGQGPRTDEVPGYGSDKPRSSKTLLAVVGLVVVLMLAGAAIFVFTTGNAEDDAVGGSGEAIAQTSQKVASAAQPAAVVPNEPAQVPLSDVFTFRDIFEPAVKTATPSESDGGGTSSDGGGSTTTSGTASGDGSTEGSPTVSLPENTLLLQDITVEDGEKTAIFVWNGATYATHEGDQIDDSPWQVLAIGDNSAVMLYGDTQVALSVGQAITK